MTSLTDSDGKAHEYFGGQKFNEELAKAAANVSTGYKFLPFEVYARGKFGDYAGDAYTGKTTLSDAVASWPEGPAGLRQAAGLPGEVTAITADFLLWFL